MNFKFSGEFAIGDRVYLRVCGEKRPGIVTGAVVRDGLVQWLVTWGDADETTHFGFELTSTYEPDFGE